MRTVTQVIIGIQARSTSLRFPGKIFEKIQGRSVLDHVLDAADSACHYINRWGPKNGVQCRVVLLIPTGDKAKDVYRKRVKIFEGDEHDVLNRYFAMACEHDADYIVRITGDCPLIPANLISKHIQTALKEKYDYLSNVDPRYRTSPDGMDCEIMSMKALELAFNQAKGSDREHVTPYLRSGAPGWIRTGHMVGFVDLAGLKLSLDTQDDLERIRKHYGRVKAILDDLEDLYGKKNVHRF